MITRSTQPIVFLSLCVGCVLLGALKPIAAAETTTQTFTNADRYVGEIQNGQFHGQGTYFFSNGNEDRKSVALGKSVDLGGSRNIQKKKATNHDPSPA